MILLSQKGKSKEESDSHADFSVIFKAEAYMESTIKDLMERRSCRSYSDKQITDAELNTVLEAGLIAPSAMNRQSSIFVVVQDKETIAKLSKMNAAIMHSDKDPFYGAPTVIIVLADRNNANAVADGSLAYPAWYDLGSQPIHMFSVSELYFILSEVKLRLNEDGTTEFQKAVAASVSEMSQDAIAELERNGKYTLQLSDGDAIIETSDVEIFSEDIPGWLVANEGKLTVALEVTITEPLRREGIARELVNRIQNIRKGSGFEITDKIAVFISKNSKTDDAINEYNTYICNQVLANSLDLVDDVEDGTELDFDDFSLVVKVIKL